MQGLKVETLELLGCFKRNLCIPPAASAMKVQALPHL